MSLAGLLTTLDDDPQLHELISRADGDGTPDGAADTDLVAPPTLRPVLAAALARGARGGTSAARPVAWLGSAMTGRWVSSLIRSAPPRSKTLRVS